MAQYIKYFVGLYSRPARKGYNQLFKPLQPKAKQECRDAVEKYVGKDTLYPALSNIVYGHIIPELDKIDDIRLSVWITNYGMDAAESTIPIKFGPQGKACDKYRLTASGNHICDDWGYRIWYTRFLEKAAERYDIMLVQQLAGCIARNMQLVKKCKDFSIKLSMDTGTQSNANNVRNCLMEGIYKHLQISPSHTFYNNGKIISDLRQFRVTVM